MGCGTSHAGAAHAMPPKMLPTVELYKPRPPPPPEVMIIAAPAPAPPLLPPPAPLRSSPYRVVRGRPFATRAKWIAAFAYDLRFQFLTTGGDAVSDVLPPVLIPIIAQYLAPVQVFVHVIPESKARGCDLTSISWGEPVFARSSLDVASRCGAEALMDVTSEFAEALQRRNELTAIIAANRQAGVGRMRRHARGQTYVFVSVPKFQPAAATADDYDDPPVVWEEIEVEANFAIGARNDRTRLPASRRTGDVPLQHRHFYLACTPSEPVKYAARFGAGGLPHEFEAINQIDEPPIIPELADWMPLEY